MTVVTTYPGVYIEEIPSGSVTISGVATSITAFVGRAMMGPPNTPTTCFSFGDFERFFGGRAYDFPMSYAVEDFFLNGGGEAIIVRLEASTPLAAQLDSDAAGILTTAQAAQTKAGDLDAANTALTQAQAADKKASTPATRAAVAQAAAAVPAAANAKAAVAAATTYSTAVATAKADDATAPTPTVMQARLAAAVAAGGKAGGVVSAGTAPKAADMATEAANLAAAAVRTKAAADGMVNAAGILLGKATDADAKASTADTQKAVADANTRLAAVTAQQTKAQAALDLANAYLLAALAALPNGGLLAAYQAGALAGSTKVPSPPGGPPAPATLALSGWIFQAANNGVWGNNLVLTIDTTGITDDVAKRYGSTSDNSFNLTVTYTKPNGSTIVERYNALNVDDTPYRADRVLRQQSNLVAIPNWPASGLAAPAAAFKQPFAGGVDGPNLSETDLIGDQDSRTGIYALEHTDLFNLLCLPWDKRGSDWTNGVLEPAAKYCADRRAMFIVDAPDRWTNLARQGQISQISPSDLGIGTEAEQRNSMVYFPKVKKADAEMGGHPDVFPPCGIIAGQIAQTDATRGVWKAPAGIAAGIGGILDLDFNLTDPQQGQLNPLGINCLRSFRVLGPLVWGARTLRGADLMADDYKYVPVRRLTLFIEESLYRGTKFAVFEPNDETLWSQLRLAVGAFMADLSRQGAFYGYSVACDKTTTTPYDIERGICNVRVAFAPVKPAEFIVLQIQQQTAAQVTA